MTPAVRPQEHVSSAARERSEAEVTESTFPGDAEATAPRVPLAEVAALASAAACADLRAEADALAQRVAEGRFYVACLGQFKRGKSTLLDALVGAPLLPTGVVPVTSVVTVIRYGEQRGARVRTAEGCWRDIPADAVREYVTEQENPGNAKKILGVELFEPAALLATGLCLVDTPGIGSVIAANTDSTRDFLPHVDAALIVLGADPPITADEAAVIESLGARVRHRIFVIAKADKTSDIERREAGVFTRRVLKAKLREDVGPLLEVSAAEVMAAGAPSRDWASLQRTLAGLARDAGSELVFEAERRGASNLLHRLVDALEEQLDVLVRPVSESEARLAALRGKLAEAERALADLAPLLRAEEARLLGAIEREHVAFFDEATPRAVKELEAALAVRHEGGPALRARSIEESTSTAHRILEEWRRTRGAIVDEEFRRGMRRFVEILAVIERDLPGGELAGRADSAVVALRAPSRYYMTELLTLAPTSSGRHLLDVVGVRSARWSRAIRRQAVEYLRRLLEVNGARAKNDLRERVVESRRGLEADVLSRLRELGSAAAARLEQARRVRDAGAAAVAAERERLTSLLESARALRGHAAP
jgi:hypothetical protein